eukprot:TRINITY_DN32047_c0_g1_i1.p1 TRINITY_DN32047_c0_g1~~TRINITY_DN32047_c0_g1_i1.p1  ORF type:complete len:763 (+),score=288.00 TRINITY_DN32047_c0_g1_i1:58-2346(+)
MQHEGAAARGGGAARRRLVKKKGSFRRRDLLIFIGCLVGVILSFQSDSGAHFTDGFQVFWVYEHMSTEDAARLPKPIVADVDGDGMNEIVACTAVDQIAVLNTYRAPRAVGGYVQELTSRYTARSDGSIIGFAVGDVKRNITNATKPDAPPKLKTVTVSDEYIVTLYDHKLLADWVVRLPVPTAKENYMYSEMADAAELYNWYTPTTATVTVLPNRVYEDDEGLVIVGVEVEFPMDLEEAEDDEMGEPVRQWSYFALNAKDGALRWSHNSTDEVLPSQDAGIKSQHNYKLTLQNLQHHSGETDWRYFRRNFVAALPHSVSHPHEAKLQIHRFAPKKNRAKKEAKQKLDKGDALPVKDKSDDRSRTETHYSDLGEKVWTLMQWRKHREVMPHPNVILAHRPNGLEALHLYTGRLIAQVGPFKEGVLYDDVNDDTVIDAVNVFISDSEHLDTYNRRWGAQKAACQAVIESGVPFSREHFYNHSVCVEGGLMHNFEFLRSMMKSDAEEGGAHTNHLGGFEIPGFGGRDHFDESLTAATPLSVHRHVHHGPLDTARFTTDLLFFISSGLVTALDGKTGKARWHADTNAMFGAHASGMAFARRIGRNAEESTAIEAQFRAREKEAQGTYAHLKAYSPMTRTEPDTQEDTVTIRNVYNVFPSQFVLAVGHKKIVMINDANGHIESEIELKLPPVAPVQIADVNNDGVNDLLVITKEGIHGYLGKVRKGATVITVTLSCVMALLGLLFMTHSSVQTPGKPSRRLKRSTD